MIDLYCEREGPGLAAEPINALTNLAFLVAAWATWRLMRQSIRGVRGLAPAHADRDRSGGQRALSHLRNAVGSRARRPAHPAVPTRVPLALRAPPPRARPSRLRHDPRHVPRGRADRPTVPGGSQWLAHICAGCARHDGAWDLPSGHCPAGTGRAADGGNAPSRIAVVLRSIDQAICGVLPIGTHFLWHLLTALVCYVATRALLLNWSGTGRRSRYPEVKPNKLRIPEGDARL